MTSSFTTRFRHRAVLSWACLALTTKRGEWEEHRLPIKDFVPTFRGRVLTRAPVLDPGKVTSVGLLISDKQVGPFQLELAWIKADSASTHPPDIERGR